VKLNNNISNFITDQKEGKGFWQRFFYQPPEIFPTKEFAYDIDPGSLNNEIEIKPSPVRKFFNWIIALFFFCATITVSLLFIAANIPIGIAGIGLCVIVYFIMVRPLLLKENFYTIIIDSQGLRMGQDSYPWCDLSETYIMYKLIGRSTHCYLLLETKTNQVVEFDLDSLAIDDSDIASLIEAYKRFRLHSVTNTNKATN
jgi:hypothetical protein